MTPGKPDLRGQLSHAQRRERRQFGGLKHQAIPRRQRRAHLPAGEHHGEIPRYDQSNNADRFPRDVGQKAGFSRHDKALILIGHAGEITKHRRGAKHIEISGVADWMSGIERLD